MKPNIVFIYADDLGRGMLSGYSQRHYRTPHIDRLAAEGMRCTSAYGCALCAPARAALLTGVHDAHAGRWTFNRSGLYNEYLAGRMTQAQIEELLCNTGIRPREGDLFLAEIARQAGLITGQIGKLEWGFSTCDREIRRHGWDYHYGYYDHGQCHGFYPPYVFEDGRRVDIPGNTDPTFGKGHYGPFPNGEVEHNAAGRAVHSQDLYDAKIVEFLRRHKEKPFFLYHPTQLPHGPVYFPDLDPQVANNPALTQVEKEYASMVLRLDRTVGLILDTLRSLGLEERTLVIFTSDNGHWPCYEQPGRCYARQTLDEAWLDDVTTKFHSDRCGDILDGNDGMAGLKTSNWEGATRVPFLARWPGHVPAGSVSERLIANFDMLATVADLAGIPLPQGATDGLSLLPALRADPEAPEHDHIVYSSHYGPSLVTRDGWKLRTFVRRNRILDFGTFGASLDELREAFTLQLYRLTDDYREERDLAAEHPEKLTELRGKLLQSCDGNLANGTPEAHFAFYPMMQT